MIFIKGMKMPNTCEECEFASWSNLCQTMWCNRIEEPTGEDFSRDYKVKRAEWCPLVEVEEAEESDDCLTNFLIAIAKERERDETIGEVKIGNYRVTRNRFSQVWRYEPEGDKE